MKKQEKNKKAKKPPVKKRKPARGSLSRVNDKGLEWDSGFILGLLENIEIGYFEMDLRGNYGFFNDVLCRKLGYSREELLGMNYRAYSRPEDIEFLQSIYGEVYRTGKPKTMINTGVIKKDGSQIIVEQSISLKRGPTGEAIGFQVVAREITERINAELALKKSEEKYRTILETMEEGLFENDLMGNYTFVNEAACRLLGYEREEMMGMNYRRVFSPDMVERIYKIYNGIYKTGESKFLLDFEVIRKDGSVRIHQANAALIRDASNKPKGFRVLVRDVTERKQTEKEKARLEEQLLQAQKMESVGRLAGGVAHDFNNMLSVILGYSELIKLNLPQGDPLLMDVMEIEKAASRSRDITRQLLAFSRKQIIAPALVDLNVLITGIQKTLSRLIGEDVDLQFFPTDDLWKIKFDPSQMQQILINLSANARDAMPNGGKLTIETRKIYLDEDYCKMNIGFSPGHYVLLGVSDDGAGMDRETLQNVFEPFFTTKETGKGTGLGLAMVYGIIKQNDGFINVYSEPGKGTTFKIYIPRSIEEGEAPEEVEEAVVASGSGTVLLVEDDDMVRKMATEMLEAIGYTVLPTGDPAEALTLCENDDIHIDLLITDVVMPGMSGKELRDRIEAKRPEIKVLFMSGYTSNVIVHRGVLEDGVHFVQKPFSMSDLARNVRIAINRG